VQCRIVVVFKQQKNLWLPPVAPGLLSIIVAIMHGQQPPRFISLFLGARIIHSSPQQASVCAKLHKSPPSLRLRGTSLPPSSSWRCRSNRGLHSLLPQRAVFPSPRRQCRLSRGDLTQPEQGELVQATSLHNCNHREYFRRLEASLTFGKKGQQGRQRGGGDALPTTVNGVTFDDVEATADFVNQLGPPPAEVITQMQGDAPTAGNIPCYPAPPGVGGGMNPPPPPPQQAGMGGGNSPPGIRHTPASTPSSKNWGAECTTRRPSRPSSQCS